MFKQGGKKMPRMKFEMIYNDLKARIESEEYAYQEMLPSENAMVNIYQCSRNTIRRAISMLAGEGYVQSLHGKGVRVIYQRAERTSFTIGGIESFKESARRNHKKCWTNVMRFEEMIAEKSIERRTGFKEGSELYYIERVRYIDGKPIILDINLFLKEVLPGLTPEIAGQSVYEYIENTLGMQIVTSKRRMTVERTIALDEEYLDLGDYNFMAVIAGQTFNADGVMFEYTQSRHHPDYFCFQDTAVRRH